MKKKPLYRRQALRPVQRLPRRWTLTVVGTPKLPFEQRRFQANAKEGIAVDWPIRYDDLAPWYDYVEKFAINSGNRDGLDALPDGVYQPPMLTNIVRKGCGAGEKGP